MNCIYNFIIIIIIIIIISYFYFCHLCNNLFSGSIGVEIKGNKTPKQNISLLSYINNMYLYINSSFKEHISNKIRSKSFEKKYRKFLSFYYFVWKSMILKKLCSFFNHFSPSQYSTSNFALHNTLKIRHVVMRKWELIKQSKQLKIKSKIISNLFNEKYGLKLKEFNHITWTERIKATLYPKTIFSLLLVILYFWWYLRHYFEMWEKR